MFIPEKPAGPMRAKDDGWIVASLDGQRFRTWADGIDTWTHHRGEATRYARPTDAEAVHHRLMEREWGWRVVAYDADPARPAAATEVAQERGILLAADVCDRLADECRDSPALEGPGRAPASCFRLAARRIREFAER